MKSGFVFVAAVAINCALLVRQEAAAFQKSDRLDWGKATVVDVFPPEWQKRREAKSPEPVAAIHKRSPYPLYTAPQGITRWVFVLESGGETYAAASRALRGDSPLRQLQRGDAAEMARGGERDIYIRVSGGKYEKLRLLETRSSE